MKQGEIALHKERWVPLADCAVRFLLGVILAGAQVFGGYAPFVPAIVSGAGAGKRGLAALLGGALGSILLLDFSFALRTIAAAILIDTANNAFCETKWYRSRWFVPASTAGLYLAVEFVYLTQSSADEVANCLLSILVSVLAAVCCRDALSEEKIEERRRQGALLVMVIGVLMALASVELAGGFAPGRILAMLLVMLLAFDRPIASALAAALAIGLAMDMMTGEYTFLHAAAYGFGALAMSAERRHRRAGAAAAWCVPLLLLPLPLPAEEGIMLLYEGLSAALLFLLLPRKTFQGKRIARRSAAETEAAEEQERSVVRRRLGETATVLRELYDVLVRVPEQTEENPAAIFDRAAERVCRGCTMRTICWERDYNATYNALNDATAALLAQGRGRGGDFPAHFVDRCIRFPSFLSAVNAELSAYLLRRQYRARLRTTCTQSASQYAQLSDLLTATAQSLDVLPAVGRELLPYQLGAALRPKEGEAVSGDSMTHFETDAGTLCLLLSDGMGCGEAARRESALAVRLLERFLRAGIEAPSALKTLNSALALRAEMAESFTTIDLMRLDLRDGAAEIYKYGAAPSYVKRGARVKRITTTCLPAGMQPSELHPETTRFKLEKKSFFIMVTDGIADVNDDAWLQKLLESWQGDNPQALVSAILRESRERRGVTDDGGVLVLYLPENNAPSEV